MSWYWIVAISVVWLAFAYVWVLFGAFFVCERYEKRSDQFVNETDLFLIQLLGLLVLVLSWPLIAGSLGYLDGISWYWWLLIFDIMGLPWAIMVTIEDICDRSYTYGELGIGAKIFWSIAWLVASICWPLQWVREFVIFD